VSCWLCGEPARLSDPFVADHIVPVSLGGRDGCEQSSRRASLLQPETRRETANVRPGWLVVVMGRGAAVIVDQGVLSGDPIRTVTYLQPEHESESGYAVWSVPPEAAQEEDAALVCLDCLIDDPQD